MFCGYTDDDYDGNETITSIRSVRVPRTPAVVADDVVGNARAPHACAGFLWDFDEFFLVKINRRKSSRKETTQKHALSGARTHRALVGSFAIFSTRNLLFIFVFVPHGWARPSVAHPERSLSITNRFSVYAACPHVSPNSLPLSRIRLYFYFTDLLDCHPKPELISFDRIAGSEAVKYRYRGVVEGSKIEKSQADVFSEM